VKTVALQSTGILDLLYDILEERGFEVYLVNADTPRICRDARAMCRKAVADEITHLRVLNNFVFNNFRDSGSAHLLAAAGYNTSLERRPVFNECRKH